MGPKLSPTRIAVFQRCRQRYYWTYVDHSQKADEKNQKALTAGSVLHAGMATYLQGGDNVAIIASMWEELAKPHGTLLEEQVVWFRKLSKSMERYIAQDSNLWEVDWVEREVDASWTTSEGKTVVLTGRWDAVVRTKQGSWIVDHKFSENSSSLKIYDHNWQAAMYLLQAQLLGESVSGVIFNLINYVKMEVRQKVVTLSPTYLVGIRRELEKVHQEIESNSAPVRSFAHTCIWECPFSRPCLEELNK